MRSFRMMRHDRRVHPVSEPNPEFYDPMPFRTRWQQPLTVEEIEQVIGHRIEEGIQTWTGAIS